MEVVNKLALKLRNWEYTGLCLLVLFSLTMHFVVITQPDNLVYDEKFYVADARHILDGEGSDRIEHPPLGRLSIAGSMFLFGDNPFGWRFLGVLSGAACIIIFYLICRQLGLSKKVSFIATFLLSLENLSFIQSSIAMLDVYSLTFMLGAFLLYLKGRYLSSGLLIGLSALAKLSGALGLLVIALHWLLTGRQRKKRFLVSMLSAPVSFLLLMPLFDFLVYRQWLNPFSQIETMLRVSGASTFAQYPSEMLSRPWEWIFKPEIITYWPDPNYIAMISPSLWILIIPAALYMFYRASKGNLAALFGSLWLAGTYLIWIPASLITDRISYVYYFYPTVGAISIGVALGLSRLSNLRPDQHSGIFKYIQALSTPVYLFIHLAVFVLLSPVAFFWKVTAGTVLYISTRFILKNE